MTGTVPQTDVEAAIRDLQITDERYGQGWLDKREISKLVSTPMPADTALLLHLELCLGLRRVESNRLLTSDVDLAERVLKIRRHGYNTVIGSRIVPFVSDATHPLLDTATVIGRYIEYRSNLVDEVRDLFPDTRNPRGFMIFRSGFNLRAYSDCGKSTSYRLRKLGDKTGVNVSNPVLRRTFAHNLLSNGAAVDEVAVIMGILGRNGHSRRIGDVRTPEEVMRSARYDLGNTDGVGDTTNHIFNRIPEE